MNYIRNSIVVPLTLALLVTGALLYFSQPNTAKGASYPGQPAVVATTSIAAVTSTASTIIATSSCTSRIVSTGATGIMLTFSDNQGAVPSATFGHWQAASSTVVYDSGLFGCGAVKAYSGTNQSLTVAETR